MKKDKAYKFIKEKILNRSWDVGVTINVNEVCSMLGMSRTPVQEALTRLAQEGLVSIVPQVGAYVRRPTSQEMFERLLVRASFESLLTEWAACNVSKKQLDTMDSILCKMEQPGLSLHEYAALNKEFHCAIYQASGLTYIQNLADQHWDYFEYAAITLGLFKKDRLDQSLITEHRMIFYSIKEGNKTLAKLLMEQHLLRITNLAREKDESKSED